MPTRRKRDFDTLKSNTLFIKAEHGCADDIKALLNAGADPNVRGGDHRSALHVAAQRGHMDAVGILLDAGADPNVLDKDDLTPLYWAAYLDHPEVVEVLLNADATPNVGDRDGRTPLHWVSYNRGSSHKTCRALLVAGADPRTPDNGGWYPQHRPRCDPYKSVQET